MRYAELTGSSTKPLPSHRPWSGGSNVCSKLVNWLSRLLTPSKLTRGELVAAAATAADAGAPGIISVAEKWPDGSRRARSEERRVGKECRSRGSRCHEKKRG